ncbi:MAG: putative Sulfite:cytochrome c oxidoreductase, subunit [Cyanobacteria bacterium RYN_339]|nr:putative Sulfite:cytochrome c oxidoreductase, subunit [Cyanobacteria bacterium RYN_339]
MMGPKFDRRRFLGLTLAAGGLANTKGADFYLHSSRPLDLETPVEAFRTDLTPNEAFFVRSHHDEPTVDARAWRLRVEGLVGHKLSLSLADLKKLPRHELTAVLQCAGNGRGAFRPGVPGVAWQVGGVGNARWAGVRLADVLARAGLKPGAAHVGLHGVDAPVLPTTPKFARSIPLPKALHPDTLLAYEMNGAPLPRLHGFPLRVVVPGWVGDDWIKWLERIEVRADEDPGFFVQKGYRYPVHPGPPGEPVPVEATAPMTELVVKSLIAAPAHHQRLKPGPITVEGVAWTGGDARIAQVEISVDGNVSWRPAELLGEDRPYGWRRFRAVWSAPAGHHVVSARATDTRGAAQPLQDPPWNPGGYLWNGIHGVVVEVGP